MNKALGAFMLAISLGGCGGSSNSAGNGSVSDNGASMVDAFTSYVASLVGTAPDDTEPVAIESVAVTSSESAEPAAVK